MIWSQGSLGMDILWALTWGAVLAFVYMGVMRALLLLPLGDDQRSRLARAEPLFALLVSLIYGLFAVHAIFARYPGILPFALLLVLVAFFIGGRPLISDFFAGVAVRSESSCRIGDHVRIGETQGRVTALGPRAISLETPDGDNALVPYSQALRLPIVQTRALDRGASLSFRVQMGSELSLPELSETVMQAALTHHFSNIARSPEITRKGESEVEVTIFSLASQYAPHVEAAVRAAVSKAESKALAK